MITLIVLYFFYFAEIDIANCLVTMVAFVNFLSNLSFP
jgi:hypothetical protein